MPQPPGRRGGPGALPGGGHRLRRDPQAVAGGEFEALYFTSDALDAWGTEAEAQALRGGVKFLVVQDTLVTPLAQAADVVLPAATFAEKAGCYVNADGRLQYAGRPCRRATDPCPTSTSSPS